MDILSQTKKTCQEQNICPSRSKGQNFLIKENVYNKIITAAELKKDDVVLEVGPGLGFLTTKLAEEVKKVVAVELDDELAKNLNSKLEKDNIKNIEVLNENILQVKSHKVIKSKAYKVVANLPYNITSRFLRKFLEEVEVKPSMMVLMLQKEVAERIIASPPNMSLLAVSVQFYSEPKIIANVKKECFWPKPKVDSAIVKLKVKSEKLKVSEEEFFKIVKAGFSAKRKQLKNNLVKSLKIKSDDVEEVLIKNNLNKKIRAQELSVDDWYNIYNRLRQNNIIHIK